MDVIFQKDKKKNESNKIKEWFGKTFAFLKDKNSLFYYFLILLGIGLLFFLSLLVFNLFTTPYSGDYCAQQFSFYTNGYDDWWHFLRTGQFVLYDTNTYLGVNNIGSNAFYYLFDPFFLPILIFPRQLVPQGMAILTIFKLAFGGLAFYGYIRYLGASKSSAKIAGIAYSFCGWVTWYLWFNHFAEIIICLPLILWGVEKVLKEKKPFLLMGSLFLMGLVNFFFLICFTMCAFLYAMFRFFQHVKDRSCKENFTILGIGFIGFFAGLLMSLVIVLPAAMVAVNSDRATNATYLDGLVDAFKNFDILKVLKFLFSWGDVDNGRDYRTAYPIIDFFFPVMSDRGTPLTKLGNETYDNVAGSLFCYSPIIILFVPALIRSVKEKHYSPLIATGLFILMLTTPFFYYLFHGFTVAYSRWTLFVTISLIAYVGLYLDKIKTDNKKNILWGYLFALGGGVLSIVLASAIVSNNSDMAERFGNFTLLICGIVYVIYASIVAGLIYSYFDKSYLNNLLTGILVFESTIMGALTTFGHGYTPYTTVNNGLNENNALASIVKRINNDDDTYFRAYSSLADDNAKNDGMRNGYNGMGFFHSIYNFNILDFLRWSRMTQNIGGWSGSYVEKRQNLDTFLGVKYYFIEKDKVPDIEGIVPNVPLGYKDVSDEYSNDYFYVFENEHWINFTFAFDEIFSHQNEEGTSVMSSGNFATLRNEDMYLKYGILSHEDTLEVLEETGGEIELEENLPGNSSSNNDYSQLSISNYSYEGNSTQYVRYFYSTEETASNMDPNELAKYLRDKESEEYPGNDKGGKKVIFIAPRDLNNNLPYDEDGVIFYLNSTFQNSYKINAYLIDEDYNVITYDNHSDNATTSTSKSIRGLYSRPDESGKAKQLKAVMIVPRYFGINSYSLAYELATDYYDTIEKILQNPIENIEYTTNKFTFDTNYDEYKFIVTQLPYEDGWQVKASDEGGNKQDLKVYKAQGGFVSFIAQKGLTHYVLEFYPPYLQIGSYLSIVGMFMFYTYFISYYYVAFNLVGKDEIKKYNKFNY